MAMEKTMKWQAYSMPAFWATATEPDVYVKAEEFVRTAVADAGGDPEAAIKLAHEHRIWFQDLQPGRVRHGDRATNSLALCDADDRGGGATAEKILIIGSHQ
jgi:hypothetical protein